MDADYSAKVEQVRAALEQRQLYSEVDGTRYTVRSWDSSPPETLCGAGQMQHDGQCGQCSAPVCARTKKLRFGKGEARLMSALKTKRRTRTMILTELPVRTPSWTFVVKSKVCVTEQHKKLICLWPDVFVASCPVGSFLNATSGVCDPCAAGFYQEDEAQTSCRRCPTSLTSRVGAYTVRQCEFRLFG